MRLFDPSEIEDLAVLVNKSKINEEKFSETELAAVNEHLRKNSQYYIQSHMVLLSEKNPMSAYVNLSLSEPYEDKLED